MHSIPCQVSSAYLESLSPFIPNVPLVSASKGLHTTNLKLMSAIIPEALGRRAQPTAYISGPSFAKELVQEVPTALVVASESRETALFVQKAFLVKKKMK